MECANPIDVKTTIIMIKVLITINDFFFQNISVIKQNFKQQFVRNQGLLCTKRRPIDYVFSIKCAIENVYILN